MDYRYIKDKTKNFHVQSFSLLKFSRTYGGFSKTQNIGPFSSAPLIPISDMQVKVMAAEPGISLHVEKFWTRDC